jgi:hypothetical protein
VRPECLTAVAFLATRVECCDIDNLTKLQRLLGFLRGTRDLLRVGDHLKVHAYIDTAYDKSHTGCALVVGSARSVFVKSGKQRNVTKSSTKAELVGLSDTASPALHLRHWCVAQGHAMGRPCQARHIDIRHFCFKRRGCRGATRPDQLGLPSSVQGCVDIWSGFPLRLRRVVGRDSISKYVHFN